MSDSVRAEARDAWGPSRGRTAAVGAVGVAALVAAVTSGGGPFGLDGGLALLVLAGIAAVVVAVDLWSGTVLSCEGTGVVLRHGPWRRELIPYGEITDVRSSTTSHGILRLSSLEFDVGDRLVVLGRARLGADPDQVVERISRRMRSG